MRTRVRVAGQAATEDLAPEPVELVLVEAPLEEHAGVHTGRGVALHVDLVTKAAVALAVEEMVEPDVVEHGAADAKVDRWPPRPSKRRLARSTIAIAFQRITARMRFSSPSSPGNQGSCSGGMVLM